MASSSRDIADRLLGSSSEEEAQPPAGSRRRLEPADSSSATAAPAQESHDEEEQWQRRVVPINMFGDGVPFGTADGSVQGIDHDAVAMGIPQEMVRMFLFNIGIRQEAEPPRPSVRGTRRLWRFISAARASEVQRECQLRSTSRAIDWTRFQTDFNMTELEATVVHLAETHRANYLGVTEDAEWRLFRCSSHTATNMIAHVDRGFTKMFVLSANFGQRISLIEEHLVDVLQEHAFPHRQRNTNSRRYVRGPIIDSRMYLLYMAVY